MGALIPLLDGDVILYEVAFAAQADWKYQGGEGTPPFSFVENTLLRRLEYIHAQCGATEPFEIYFTGKNNFRYEVAKRVPYKSGRGEKPFHYYNIKSYLKNLYNCFEEEGYEADDLMAIRQTERLREIEVEGKQLPQTIICTRDKDLRSVRGWQYGWEVGNQPAFLPSFVEEIGSLRLNSKRKLQGTGFLFFASQLLTGDSVDTIRGIQGYGAVSAFKTLEGCKTKKEALTRVLAEYKKVFGLTAYSEMIEQGRLLWILRKKQQLPICWNQM